MVTSARAAGDATERKPHAAAATRDARHVRFTSDMADKWPGFHGAAHEFEDQRSPQGRGEEDTVGNSAGGWPCLWGTATPDWSRRRVRSLVFARRIACRTDLM